jgi:hypothetical protein
MAETIVETKERRITIEREFLSLHMHFDPDEIIKMVHDRALQLQAELHPELQSKHCVETKVQPQVSNYGDFEGFEVEFIYE